MFLRAQYNRDKVWVNTDYIMDVFEDSNDKVTAYLVDDERDGYVIERAAWLDFLAIANAYQVET